MPKVLVVDDNKETVDSIEQWLKFDRYEVETASDGLAALDLIAVSKFDIIVLDWDMPKLNGLELCRELRNQRKLMPILLLTGKHGDAAVELGLDSGADDYVTKPFSLKQLSARIRALLRRPDAVLPEIIHFKNVELHTVSRIVKKDMQEIDLSPKELAMLEVFMRHQLEVFTAEALIQRIWKATDEVTDLSVRNCVRMIRKKLGADIIENIYGQGYRLRS
jgi:DNA-binding response OmpR family regulator